MVSGISIERDRALKRGLRCESHKLKPETELAPFKFSSESSCQVKLIPLFQSFRVSAYHHVLQIEINRRLAKKRLLSLACIQILEMPLLKLLLEDQLNVAEVPSQDNNDGERGRRSW